MDSVTEVGLLVLGAGPAGTSAAVAAAENGVDVAVLDEAPGAGGQVYRPPMPAANVNRESAIDPDFRIGEDLRESLAASAIRSAFGRRVWFAAPGFRVSAVGPEGVENWQAKAVVVATGTHERIVPFPGWTLPGIIGLGAATILLKAHRAIPGESTVVAGCGPLVAAVAAGIVKGGGKVAAMVDAARPGDWLGHLPALMSRPDLLWRGIDWLRQVRRAGVPMKFGHAVTEVHGGDTVREVVVAPVDSTWRPRSDLATHRFTADSVAVGHGLIPATEVTRVLGAEHVFDWLRGGWIPVRDGDFRCTSPGLYAVGDCGGISGAAAAVHQGRIAGLAAALDLGRLDKAAFTRAAERPRSELRRAERFAAASAAMMAPRSGLLETATAETVMCRCEDITREEIETAVAQGARDINQIKSWTRCGMGPCQGRMCGDSVAGLMAPAVGGREEAGRWTARVPLRPIPFEGIVGDYEYDSIPKPAPSPVRRQGT